MRRIGFGEATRSQVLIDRTLAEVAGTLLTAELALEHGLACNTAGGEQDRQLRSLPCRQWGAGLQTTPA